tara:strand:+ start:116 stop:352 length:237 start_codon:yes stop_codon:yes gene_type:complete
MESEEKEIDITEQPVQEQIEFVDQAIMKATEGVSSKIITNARIVATYSLPNALKKGVRCRVIPNQEGSVFSINIVPKD